jgi:SNF2 family DNA or RNA helicase
MLQNYAIRYNEREFAAIPEPIYIKRTMDFTGEQRERYLQALEGLINAGGSLKELEAQWFRMRQIASGYLGWGDEFGKHIVHFKENPKLEMLESIFEEAGDAKVVVSYEYTETGRLICAALDRMGVKHRWLWSGTKDPIQARKDFIEQEDVRGFVMNSESGGTGLDGLQKVSRYLILYESPTSPITRRQVIKRIHRPGQPERAYVYDFVMRRSVDVTILEDALAGIDTHASVVDDRKKLYTKLKKLVA